MQEIATTQISEEELRKRTAHLSDWLRRIRRERRKAILRRGLGLIITCVFVSRLLGWSSGFFPFFFVFAGGGGAALLGLGTLNPLREAARDVIALDDVRTIEVLLQALHAPDSVTVRDAASRVTQLLPRLCAEDRSWMTVTSVREITSFLFPSGPPDMRLSSLRALEYVGDAQSLGAVDQIVKTTEGSTSELAAEARRILPILKARIEAEAQAAKLLRSAVVVAGVELLRPTTAHGEATPEHLLRPAPEIGAPAEAMVSVEQV